MTVGVVTDVKTGVSYSVPAILTLGGKDGALNAMRNGVRANFKVVFDCAVQRQISLNSVRHIHWHWNIFIHIWTSAPQMSEVPFYGSTDSACCNCYG